MYVDTHMNTLSVVGSSITHRGEWVGACEISPDKVSHTRGISLSRRRYSEDFNSFTSLAREPHPGQTGHRC